MQGLQAAFREAAPVHLQLEGRHHRAEVGVTAPLSVAVHRALHLPGALAHRGEGVRHRAPSIVVGVDAEPHRAEARRHQPGLHRPHGLGHLPRQGPTVGVAQDQSLGPTPGRRFQRGEGVSRVRAPAVEEVLGVVDDAPLANAKPAQALLDEPQVLVEAGAEHLLHVEDPGLAHHRAHRGAGLHQRAQVGVVGRIASHPAGGAEGGDGRVLPVELPGARKELGVLGVGAGPTAFDEGHPQRVEPPRDAQLVGAGEGDALALRAVAEGGVVDLDHRSGVGVRGPDTIHDHPGPAPRRHGAEDVWRHATPPHLPR